MRLTAVMSNTNSKLKARLTFPAPADTLILVVLMVTRRRHPDYPQLGKTRLSWPSVAPGQLIRDSLAAFKGAIDLTC